MEQEPRLGGLAGNAVFRMMGFYHKAGLARSGPAAPAVGAIKFFLGVIILFALTPLGLIVYLGLLSAFGGRGSPDSKLEKILAIPKNLYLDLHLAGIPHESFATACWGRAAREVRLIIERVVVWFAFAGVLAWSFWVSFFAGWRADWILIWSIFGAVGLLLCGFRISFLRHAPYHLLPELTRRFTRLNQSLAWDRNSGGQFGRGLAGCLYSFVRVTVIVAVVLTLFLPLSFAWSILMRDPIVAASAVQLGWAIAIVSGIGVGHFRGLYVKKHADEYIGKLNESWYGIRLWQSRRMDIEPGQRARSGG